MSAAESSVEIGLKLFQTNTLFAFRCLINKQCLFNPLVLQTIAIAAVVLKTFVDTKHKICKKVTLGKGADQYPQLATYFKAIGHLTYARQIIFKGVTRPTNDLRCTGFFVEMNQSDVNYIQFFDKSSNVVNYTHLPMRLLNKGVNMTISFGNIQLSTPPVNYISINVTRNTIRVPVDFNSSTIYSQNCRNTFDVGIVELSPCHCAKLKKFGRFLTFDDISGATGGQPGENCWVAGFAGDSHGSKLQVANVIFAKFDECFKESCITENMKDWYFCYNRVEQLAVGVGNNLTEGGDSGSPVWCLSSGLYRVNGIAVIQKIKANAAPPGIATNGEKLIRMMLETYKNG